jgi:hypothetical protein
MWTFLPRCWNSWRGSSHALTIVKSILLWASRLVGRVDFRNATSPFTDSRGINGRLMRWLMWLALCTLDTPLWPWRDAYTTLIGLRMDILGCWGIVLVSASTSTASEKL